MFSLLRNLIKYILLLYIITANMFCSGDVFETLKDMSGKIPKITSITSDTSAGTYGGGSPIDIKLTFSAPVTLAGGILNVTLDTGAMISISPFNNSNTAHGTYTVASGENSSALIAADVYLIGGTLKDDDGTDTVVELPDQNINSNKIIVIDTIGPAIVSITSSTLNGTYGIGSDIDITVTFNDFVTLIGGTLDITLETGTADTLISINSIVSANSVSAVYTVQSGDVSPDLNSTVIALNGGTLEDAGSNPCSISLPVGNNIANTSDIIVDGKRPVIKNVTSLSADGTYGIGSPVSVQVEFWDGLSSENVTVTGTPQLTLETGTTDAVVNYTSGSGTNILTFNYTVGSGNVSSDLDYFDTNSLSLNGGTIRDQAGNNAIITLAAPGGPASLGNNKDIIIEGTTPTITNVTSPTASGTYGIGSIVSLQIQFSENVNVTGTPQLTLETGTTDAVVNYSSGSGTNTLTFNYTVASGETSSDLNYAATNSLSGIIRDAVLNNADLTLPALLGAGSLATNKDIVIDGITPTITNVTSSTSDGSYKAGDSISIQVVFSHSVTVTGTPQLTLETGTTDAAVDYSSGSGTNTLTFNYTVASGENSLDLNYKATDSLLLNSGTIQKTGTTNNANLALPATGGAGSLATNKAIIVEGTIPTITNVTSSTANGTYGTGSVVSVQLVFSEIVTVTGTPQLTLETGTSDAVVDYTSGSGSSTLTFNYTVASGENTADLNYVATNSLNLNSGTIQDAAFNNADLSLPALAGANSLAGNKALVIEGVRPTITNVTSPTANSNYMAGSIISVQVSFSENVTVTGTPQLTLETGTTDAIVNYASGSGSSTLTFNYTVASGENSSDLDYADTSSLKLNGGTIKDQVPNNPNDADLTLAAPAAQYSLGYNKAIVIDTTLPTITNVTASNADATYGIGNIISVQITFSEIVTVTGTPQLTLETGATDAVVDYTSGSGTAALTFNYTVASGHTSSDLNYVATTSLALNSGTIQDAALNNATLTLPGAGVPGAGSLATNKAIVIDGIIPTVSNVTSSTTDGSYKATDIISIQVVFSDSVTVTGTPQLTLETGTTDAIVDYSSGSGSNTLTFNYTIAGGENSSDLNYQATNSLSLNSGTIQKTGTTNNANLTLPLTSGAGSLATNKAIIVDTALPTVTNVTSSTANNTYGIGSVVSVQLVFSEIVTVTGTPQLTLETGTTDAVVDYLSGSGTNTLTFNYTVANGENTLDLNYVATNSLSLNGGTIRDAVLNNATLTLPDLAGANSLAGNKSIIIDGVLPAITNVTSSTPNGYYKVGNNIPIQIEFSENVTVTGTPQLTLETGTTDAVVDYSSGSGSSTLTFNYTVASGETSLDLNYVATTSLTLNSGTIRDAALNDAILSLPALPGNSLGTNKNIIIDTTLPVINNVTATNADATYGIGNTIYVQIVFAENVTVTGTPQLTLETGTSDAVVNYTSGSGTSTLVFEYTVASGQVSSDLNYFGTNSLSLNSGTIQDQAGNNAVLTLPALAGPNSLATNKAIVIDGIIPTVTNVTSSTINGSYKAGDVVSIQVVFSHIVTVTGTPQLTLETGTTDAVVNYSLGTGTDTLTFTYTIGSGENSADLDYQATFSLAGTIQKTGTTNNANLTLPATGGAGSLADNKAIIVDTALPTVTNVTSSTIDGTYGIGSAVSVQIQFSESVTVTGTPQLTLETGGTDALVDYTSGSGTGTLTFNYTVANGENNADLNYAATNSLALNSGTIKDAALNDATLTLPALAGLNSLATNKNIVIEGIRPTVTNVTSPTANGSYRLADTILIDVTFSEPVDVTGNPFINLANGGAGANANYSSGTGTNTLRFSYSVSSGDNSSDLDYIDTTSLKLNGGTIKDIVPNNPNDADLTLTSPGTQYSLGYNKAIVIDTTAAVITNVTATNSDGTYGIGSAINVQVVFSENVTATDTPQLMLETGATDTVVNYSSGSGTGTLVFTYTVASGHVSSDLDYLSINSLSLNTGTIRDQALNNANLSLPSPGLEGSLGYNKAIVIDGIIPSVTNVTSLTANGSYNSGDVVSIQVVFSHSVTVTGTPRLTLETGITDAPVDYTSGSGTNTLTFEYTIAGGHTSSDLNYVATDSLSLNGGTIQKSGTANNANLTLPTLGGAGTLAANKALVVDTTVPTVANVTSSAVNGTYSKNATIPIQMVFSEPVTVSGTPQLTLETGAVDAVVNYTSGSGTNTLTFDYPVVFNHLTVDLDYYSTGSLDLNGGSITDIAGNNAAITLPSPGAEYSLGYNKAIVINTNEPSVVSVSSSTGNGSYRDSQSILIQIEFSESVTVTGTPRLTLETGTNDAVINYTSGSPSTTLTFTYTVSGASSHTSSDLDYTGFDSLSLNGGTIKQTVGVNDANLTLPMPGASGSLGSNNNIIVDTTAPAISNVTSSKANGTYGAAEVIPVQITFSENVTVTGTPQLTLETGGTDAVVDYSSGSGTGTLTFNYTVAGGDTSSDLNYAATSSLVLNSGTIRDTALNDAFLTLPALLGPNSLATNKNIVVNTTPKEVQFTAATSSNPENTTSINIPVELSVVSGTNVTVDYSVTSGTATGGGADYTLAAGTATITAGSTSTNIPVTIVNDTKDEDDETIVVTLSNPGGATLGTNTTHTYTILDDDDPPSVRFSIAGSATTDESATAFNVALALSAASGKTVSVTLTDSLTGTATSGSDFSITGGSPQSVSFSAGETAKNVVITSIQDVLDEGTGETVILNLSSPVNATLGAITAHTVTITDDDGTPTLSVVDRSVTEGNSGTANAAVTVNMAGTSGSTVTVNYATSNGTADASDYSPTSGTLTWTAGQTGAKTFNVSINGDTLAETDETVILTISTPVNATISDASGVLTITNNDATLTIVSAQTLDCDPVDGHIDHYKITFSEPVTDSTFEGYVVNGEGSITDKWNVASYSNIRLDHGTAMNSIGGTDTANDNIIYLKFDQSSYVDTGNVPALTASAATIQASGGAGKINYNTGNVLSTDGSRIDSARPYIWYAFAENHGGIDGHAGISDTLQLRFSETTNTYDLTGTDLDTVLSANNSHDFGASSDISSAVWSSTNYTNDTLTITFASGTPTVDDGDSIKATGSLITDLNSNSPESTTYVFSPPLIAGTFDAGAIGPAVILAEYLDADSNGYIDHVKITYSKAVNDSSFPGYVADNRVNSVQTAWKVTGYNNVALDTTNSINGDVNTADDNVQYLKFAEGAEYDTGAKPDLTSTLGAAGLRDYDDGCYVNTSAADCLDPTKAVLNTTHVSEEDSAHPMIVLATARVDAPYIFVRFSENVWTTINTPACGSGGQLVAADFSYNDAGAGGATSVTNFDVDNCAETDAFVRILTDTNFVSGDIDNDEIGAAASQIYDAADNVMSGTAKKTIVATVAPYVVTASSYYNNSTGKYYFRIVYSDAMDYNSATTAANYTLIEDTATSCTNIETIPRSINAISSTVFDLETIAQCGTGDPYPTVYRITASTNIQDFNLTSALGTPNAATTVGTSSTDRTQPRLIQAVSTSPTTVRLTFSEPMKTGDVAGSAECAASYGAGGGVTCDADIDTAIGTQQLYRMTPSLGAISSVVATSDPSVFILTHADNQTGSFYTVSAYYEGAVAAIPEDKYGNPSNDIASIPDNQATFKGSGQAVNNFNSGTLFDDPFADGTDFSFAFNYKDRIYLGPNDTNSGAFRFEADATNPITVTFNSIGSSCTGGTNTFGYGSAPTTCNVDLGPYGENGIVGFNSGIVTVSSTDYEILMVGPIRQAGALYSYFTQDIDTQLNWKSCYYSPTGGGNTKSIQMTYAFGDSYYIGYSSSHQNQAPILVRWPLTASGGILSCGTPADATIRSLSWLGKQGSPANPAKAANTAAVVGIDSVIYVSSTGSPTPVNTFYIANNGGVAYSTGAPGTFTTFLTQTNLGGVTLVLPDAPAGLEKIRPGQRGVPKFVVYKNALYMARNLAVAQTSANQIVNNGAELWKCTSGCTTNTNWHKVASSANFTYLDSTAASQSGSNNTAIGFMQVNGDALYIGFDNPTHGATIWKAESEIDPDNGGNGESEFAQQGYAGLGLGLPYIYSSSSLKKQGINYIYITIGDGSWAIKVIRQRD